MLPTAPICSSWEMGPRADVVSAAGVSPGCCLPQLHPGDISLPTGGKATSHPSSTCQPQGGRNWGTSSCISDPEPNLATSSLPQGPVAGFLGQPPPKPGQGMQLHPAEFLPVDCCATSLSFSIKNKIPLKYIYKKTPTTIYIYA